MAISHLKMLSTEEVCRIHDLLVLDFAQSKDPISPAGVRSKDLLESAVGRQQTGLGEVLKYPDPIHNASTLLYGICSDHPFYNGNKRTALVSMLAHLEKNRLALYETNQQELYDFMLNIASHSLLKRDSHRQRRATLHDTDEEVEAIAKWLKERASEVAKGERVITYRQLRQILVKFGYYLENPKGNSIDICRYVTKRKGIFSTGKIQEKKRITNIGWPGEGHEISIKQIKRIREICNLAEEDGVDSDSFYSNAAMLDYFVSRYRKVLKWLART